MSVVRRRSVVILVCLFVVLILYWTRSRHSVDNVTSNHQVADAGNDDGDDDDDYINSRTAELSLQPATTADNSIAQLTRLNISNNNNNNNIDSVLSTGANEPTAFSKNLSLDKSDDDYDDDDDDSLLRRLSHNDDRSKNKSLLFHTRNRTVSATRQLPTLAGNVSAWQRDVHNVTSLHSLIPSASSSVVSGGLEKQQLNRVVISEKRRQAEQRQRRLAHKLRFDRELAVLVSEMKKGGVLEVRKKPIPPLTSLASIDSQQWHGLNTSFLHTHYPGIIPVKDYIMAEPLLSNDTAHAAGMQGHPQSLDDLTDGQIEDRFYQLLSRVHVECLEVRRMGSFDDGGYDLCTSQPYHFTPHSDCLVYSFGINFDFTFDDAMATAFGCTVKCFDPSMSIADHLHSAKVHFYQLGLGAQNTVTDRSWKLMTLRSVQSKLGHTKTVIDVLKIDIDYAEWSCLHQMLSDNSLRLVKQLIIEIHTSEVAAVSRPTSREDFIAMYDKLAALELAGFRRYNFHYNPMGTYTSVRTGKTRTCCFELNYINVHFLIPR